jgi:hypothetical protein
MTIPLDENRLLSGFLDSDIEKIQFKMEGSDDPCTGDKKQL